MIEAILVAIDHYWIVLPLIIGAGLLAGFAGGLFGIGGGIILVPSIYGVLVFLGDGFNNEGAINPDVRLPVAIGTSLAVIIVTATRSLSTHYKTGMVDVALLKSWLPWVAVGAVLSGFIAEIIPTQLLTLIFAVGALYIGYSRIRKKQNPDLKTSDDRTGRDELLSRYTPFLGVAIGFLSSLMGLGGGAAGVLVMGWMKRSIHQSVATASGFGIGVAIPGAIGFMIAGFGEVGLPAGSIGYVNTPAFIILAIMTAFTAPIGARLAHRLNARYLSMMFGFYVLVMAFGMIYDVIRPFQQ